MSGSGWIEMFAFQGVRRADERRPDRDESAGAGSAEVDGVAAGAAIAATKLEHQYILTYAQGSATTAAAATQVIHTVYGATGDIIDFKAGSVVACTGDAAITVDLKVNGTSVLLVIAFAKMPPQGQEPITVAFDGDKLHLGDSSMDATAEEASHPPIDVMPGMSFLNKLRLRLKHSDEEIEQSGLTKIIQEAEAKRDRRIALFQRVQVPPRCAGQPRFCSPFVRPRGEARRRVSVGFGVHVVRCGASIRRTQAL
jgi:hypothetical protein